MTRLVSKRQADKPTFHMAALLAHACEVRLSSCRVTSERITRRNKMIQNILCFPHLRAQVSASTHDAPRVNAPSHTKRVSNPKGVSETSIHRGFGVTSCGAIVRI